MAGEVPSDVDPFEVAGLMPKRAYAGNELLSDSPDLSDDSSKWASAEGSGIVVPSGARLS